MEEKFEQTENLKDLVEKQSFRKKINQLIDWEIRFGRMIIVLLIFVVMAYILWFVLDHYSNDQASKEPENYENVKQIHQDFSDGPYYTDEDLKSPEFKQYDQTEPIPNGEKILGGEKTVYKPFSFVAIGDSESYNTKTRYNEELIELLKNSKTLNPDFAVFTGDMITATGNEREKIKNLKTVLDNYYDLYYVAVDKHDVECGFRCVQLWHEIFFGGSGSGEDLVLYHSFDHQNTHFVILSTFYPKRYSVNEAQLQWLEEDLKNTNRENKVVISHVPPVTFYKESAKDCHDMSCSEPERTRLVELFKQYGVDLVLSGHEHNLDHQIVDGIDYVLVGNTGNRERYVDDPEKNVIKYSYIEIDGPSIKLTAIEIKKGEARIIETIVIK
ncbi:MAG: hypothetical protein GF347_04830 [Candidatus Moranbacteria bacterium]|nr:hypothetical protein [Candidatus Moranbacteria bacterium]